MKNMQTGQQARIKKAKLKLKWSWSRKNNHVCLHVCNSVSTPTCGLISTVTLWLLAERKSGTLCGASLRAPLRPQRNTSSNTLCPAPQRSGCSKGDANKLIHSQEWTCHPKLHSFSLVPCLSCRYLEYTLDPKNTQLMDVAYTIMSVANNVVGHALAWNFIRARWENLQKR